MALWYYMDGAKAKGPVDDVKLKALWLKGKVNGQTVVQRVGDDHSNKLESCNHLLNHLDLIIPAGVFRRFCAFILDTIIMLLPMVLAGFFVAIGAWGDPSMFDKENPDPRFALGLLGYYFFLLFYFPVTDSWCGGSLGKRLLGMKIYDSESFHPQYGFAKLGFWKAFARYWILSFINWIPLIGILFVWIPMVRHPYKQGWHDRAMRAIVVRT